MRLLSLLLLLVAPLALAQPGALDATFSVGGTYSYDAPTTGATRVLLRPNGRVLLIGSVQGDVSVLSLLPDGSVDTAYGAAGFATFANTSGHVVLGAALLPDGSVILSGAITDEDDTAETAVLLKLTASGAPEASFGTGGIATFGTAEGFEPTLLVAVRVLPDGGIASGGTYVGGDGSTSGMLSARFTASGALDTSFGTGGIVKTESDAGLTAFGGLFDASGALLLTGGIPVPGSLFDLDAAVARVLADGSLDASFGDGGIASFETREGFAIALDAATDASGRTIVTGASIGLFEGTSDVFVTRLRADGTLDPEFASGGVYNSRVGEPIAQGLAVAIQSDGKILFGGAAGSADTPDAFVGRLTDSGTPDPTFGTDGVSLVSFGAASVGTDLALQPDGRIVISGQRGDGNTDPLGMVVARLQNDDMGTAGETPALSGPLALSLAGPNPFARGTAVAVHLAEPLAVRVAVYDALGREVAVLHDGPLAKGRTVLAFGDEVLAPGTYWVRTKVGTASESLRVVRQ